MSDDVTNLAEVLAAHELQYGPKLGQFCACGSAGQPDPEAGQSWQEFHRTHLAQHIATLIAEARLIGAAMARTDAIAAHAELVERVEALAGGLLAAKTPEFDSKAAHPELAYRRCKVTGCNMWVWGQGTASPDDLRYCVAHDTAATIATALRALIDPEATS